MLKVEKEIMNSVFTKYHIIGLPFAVVIHHFTGLDGDNPHDHPFSFRSIILKGGYIEEVYNLMGDGMYSTTTLYRKEGDSFVVKADTIHQIIEFPEGECWTVIMPGAEEKKSGFYEFRKDGVYHRFWDQQEFNLFQAPHILKNTEAEIITKRGHLEKMIYNELCFETPFLEELTGSIMNFVDDYVRDLPQTKHCKQNNIIL